MSERDREREREKERGGEGEREKERTMGELHQQAALKVKYSNHHILI